MMARNFRPTGFTLIEVMVVAAVIAILAGIALPSYRDHVARARRADARTNLLQAAQFMQRFQAANDRFDVDRSGNSVVDMMPAGARRAPADGVPLYQLHPAITSATNPTIAVSTTAYTLTMSPITGRAMANDSCGSYTLNSLGGKGNIAPGGGVLPPAQRDACWR
jgi:type IV pilus assembly protein PilE